MPELPEVETVVRDLTAADIIGTTIIEVTTNWPRMIQNMSPAAFAEALQGRRITHLWRRAKYIVFDLDNATHLLLHLRMTGKLRLDQPGDPLTKHDHATFLLDDGRCLIFNDSRKFGRLQIADDRLQALSHLGVEPLSSAFTLAALSARLSKSTRCLKSLLLDQSTIAGLGNIYVDEALWAAGIHPQRRANTLTGAELQLLHRAIKSVLRRGIKNQGTTLGNGEANFYSVAGHRGRNADALKVFRRDGLPCPRCHATIQRAIVGQRGTHFCATCQPPRA